MPWFVNGQLVPEEEIRRHYDKILREPTLQTLPVEERAQRARLVAEQAAIDGVLLEQRAISDPRPISEIALEHELARVRESWGRGGFDDVGMRSFVERKLRLQRTHQELSEQSAPISDAEVEAFYEAHRERFTRPEVLSAAHIVKYINREQSEQRARAGIEAALAELERGEPFADVANRHSDCRDLGGDLGEFPAGTMVEEFETALQELTPGQRTGIISTPFGLHIAELRGRQRDVVAPLDEVRDDVLRVLSFARRHESYSRAIAELRRRAEIWHQSPGKARTPGQAEIGL